MIETEEALLGRDWLHFVDGDFTKASSGGHLVECDPRTGEPSFTIARGNAEDVDRAVAAARRSQPAWRALRPVERGRILAKIAQLIREQADMFVMVEQRETGKPRLQAASDVETAARYFEYLSLIHI